MMSQHSNRSEREGGESGQRVLNDAVDMVPPDGGSR